MNNIFPKCLFCGENLIQLNPMWFECTNHNVFKVSFYTNSNYEIKTFSLSNKNYGAFISLYKNKSDIYKHYCHIMTIHNILNITPDNFDQKIKTILTFS